MRSLAMDVRAGHRCMSTRVAAEISFAMEKKSLANPGIWLIQYALVRPTRTSLSSTDFASTALQTETASARASPGEKPSMNARLNVMLCLDALVLPTILIMLRARFTQVHCRKSGATLTIISCSYAMLSRMLRKLMTHCSTGEGRTMKAVVIYSLVEKIEGGFLFTIFDESSGDISTRRED